MTDLTKAADFDDHMMAIALAMAERGLGTTAFNPSVGAVIADEASGEIIARGWTQPGGRPHAEKEALRRAGQRARGKTMYVTLEPCAHTGRTPTCADAMLTAGLTRVVCAIADPNTTIAGRGFDQLRAAGIAVDVGLRADAARWLTAGHILHVLHQRPFVQLKLAVSADGRIAVGNGRPVWVTGPDARAHGHLLRAQANVIIVGVGTVLADDPALTCRLPGLAGRSPQVIILDTHARTPKTARVAPTAHMISASSGAARVDIRAVLKDLDAQSVRRVLVEGGPTVAQSFLAEDLVDELVLFRGSTPLGADGIEPLGPNGLSAFKGSGWHRTDDHQFGLDHVTRFRRHRPGVLIA
jgi:diaminohydroxyphosphoribosylaminopyrimidine deaminase / 5-amino-6-(5-phosphoribosylamino)uracil reductase